MSPPLTYIFFIRYCDFEVFRQQRFMIDGASAHEASIVHPYKKEDLSEMVGFRGLAFINNRRASRGEESNPLPPSWFTASDIAVDRLQKSVPLTTPCRIAEPPGVRAGSPRRLQKPRASTQNSLELWPAMVLSVLQG